MSRCAEIDDHNGERTATLREKTAPMQIGGPSGHTFQVPQTVSQLFSHFFENRSFCARCLTSYPERDNFSFGCHFHPSIHMSTETTEAAAPPPPPLSGRCCDRVRQSKGCRNSDHSDHMTWSTDCEKKNALYDVIPYCLISMGLVKIPTGHLEAKIETFSQEQAPLFLAGLGKSIVPSSIKKWAKLNDAIRYEDDRVDVYTEVIKEFVPYVIVRRCDVA
jgi:hypothetical protein